MKINKQKSTETINNFLQRTSKAGKQAVSAVQESASVLFETAKQENYARRLKKYNPLFPEVYQSASFNIPNMVIIVDDAVRRGIDVCEGSIGWLDKKGGMEVMYLYDEAVKMSKLNFVPVAECDAIYFVDCFDRNKFVRIDCIFSKAHEERLAELKYIAHSLGAKKCTIEISESNSETSMSQKNAGLKSGKKVDMGSKQSASAQTDENGNIRREISANKKAHRSGKVNIQFEGNSIPKKPKLKWFAHDENVKRLIEMRCKGDNFVKSETLEISGTSYATMSKATACSIDNALSVMKTVEKKNASSVTMEMQVTKENKSTLIFEVEF